MQGGLSLWDGARFVESDGALLALGSRSAVRFSGDSAPFAREVVARLASLTTADAVARALDEEAGEPVPRALVDALVRGLLDAGVAETRDAAEPERSPRASSLTGTRVLLLCSGAIAAAHAPLVVELLQGRGAEVRVATSREARRFVSKRALEALTHAPVPSSPFHGSVDAPAPHIALSEWADAVLLAPASAATLARIARGDTSDLVSAIAITTRAPVLVAPSMNEAMWAAPSVTRNVATLVSDGLHVLSPSLGLEVADAPGRRTRRIGAAPGPSPLVLAFEGWLAAERARRGEPSQRADWDALYAAPPSGGNAWQQGGLDADLAAALDSHAPPPARLCDLGCGTGAQAVALAARGYAVVAIDASAVALEQAAARDGSERVVLVLDDVTAARVRGPFDVLVDRGTLHTLSRRDRARYGRELARLAVPGATLLVVHDAAEANDDVATARLEPDALAVELPGFVKIASSRTTLRADRPGGAHLTVLRRSAAQ